MRHRKSFSKLSRNTSHRKAMLSNMATDVLLHKKIKTTTARAKAVRPMVERIITFAKKNTLGARRHVLRTVRNKSVVKELFSEIGPMYVSRNGGYTRIIKLGRRQGDGAEVSYLELVGFENVRKPKKEKKEAEKVDKAVKPKEVEKVETPAAQNNE